MRVETSKLRRWIVNIICLIGVVGGAFLYGISLCAQIIEMFSK